MTFVSDPNVTFLAVFKVKAILFLILVLFVEDFRLLERGWKNGRAYRVTELELLLKID